MALEVISDKLNDRGGIVTVQGDTQEEVQSAPARQLAIQHAGSKGISRPGTSGGPSTYPVDSEGKGSEDVLMGRVPVAAYRTDFSISGGV